MKELHTLVKKARFEYDGTLATGYRMVIGTGSYTETVTPETLEQIMAHFGRQPEPVVIGTSHDKPPAGSLGAWLIENRARRRQVVSYLAAILVEEGHVTMSGDRLLFPLRPD
ncbi:hypothetical protein GQ57_01595 [Burkholderia sp. MSh2]|uniref:Uncharacterized protein n=1 Tax=Burkholderia paludis TaxID=1506587 RepID=A0A6P2L1N3_9BURK|nr:MULTISPECIES: hypothetical protein [Burkholderia]KEZ07312.1 hypothetical protein GQ57_01595 [Burkholderia sp. MSh2]CAB3756625.1 hypothetical protein LMG30113_02727 [Burkholderia paludis]VWB63008.1 hypothetical protein BPA30113_02803 [Burkholderia paludis]